MKKLFLVIAAFAALVSCKNAVKDADSEYAVDMFKQGEVLPAFPRRPFGHGPHAGGLCREVCGL